VAITRLGNAQVWGGQNVPAQMPTPASRLYAQNVVNLVTLLTPDGAFAPDFDDEIVTGSCVTHDGRILHEPTRATLEGPDAPEVEPVEPVEPVETVETDETDVEGASS